jgi:hypothetical protein
MCKRKIVELAFSHVFAKKKKNKKKKTECQLYRRCPLFKKKKSFNPTVEKLTLSLGYEETMVKN